LADERCREPRGGRASAHGAEIDADNINAVHDHDLRSWIERVPGISRWDVNCGGAPTALSMAEGLVEIDGQV
jgi:hypothetical protein